ncbi:phosphoglycerate dehydrogenase [Thermodesulfobacteriota bacterium]
MKVLVSDELSEAGIRVFKNVPDIDVDVKTGLSHDELVEIVGGYDALVIRSATKVTEKVIETAKNLKVIGRAGIGLDNVDIPAASKHGIVVMNTPEGNTITTAEHTLAMMMALSRNIPQAMVSLKAGRWEKKLFKGYELFQKTLGLIGAGHIGSIVADRAKGLKMNVIVFDPYLKPETVRNLDLEPVSFDELLSRSDYITIHTPKTKETTNMINRETMSKMKKGAMLINCARGGIVNEDDLYGVLKSGYLAGAALDVFKAEPPVNMKLMSLPNFICTPHLGASTWEAQTNVAKDVAEQVVDYLIHGSVKNAVNMPSVSAGLMEALRPYINLAERMGMLQAQLTESPILEAKIEYSGTIAEQEITHLTTAMLKGLLSPILKEDINYVNAPHVAGDRGIKIVESKSATSEDYASLITSTVVNTEGQNIVSGTIFGKKLPRIVRINNFHLEAIPEGYNLLIQNINKPGVIGNLASTLGRYDVNISRMAVGEEREKKSNIILLTTSSMVGDEILEELRKFENITSIRKIDL